MCCSIIAAYRMKEQIKSRMEVLLHYEVEARSLDKSTSSRSLSDTAASTTGQASTEAGKTGLGRSGVREEAKADVLFNADTGKVGMAGIGRWAGLGRFSHGLWQGVSTHWWVGR